MTINDYLDMEALDNILEQWAAATHMIAVVLDDEGLRRPPSRESLPPLLGGRISPPSTPITTRRAAPSPNEVETTPSISCTAV